MEWYFLKPIAQIHTVEWNVNINKYVNEIMKKLIPDFMENCP